MAKYIGCDLGGTNLRAAIVDTETGTVSNMASIPTLARDGHDAVMARMAELFMMVIADSHLPKESIGGIGIGVPGALDVDNGVVLFLPNLPGTWPNVPLAATMRILTGLPVHILNDARSITYGEWRFGAGGRSPRIACFTIGTGVGGGLVIDHKLLLGFGGTAGELGHQTIDFNGPRCGCGNYGCLEVYASGPAIAAMGMKAVAQGLTTLIGELVDYDLNRITPEIIGRAALAGDAIARDIYEQAGYYIGVAMSNVMVCVTPNRFIVAGGVSRAGELLLDPIRRAFHQRVRIVPNQYTDIVRAQLDNQAGVIGVACWAEERTRMSGDLFS
jgi:glucokinase